ncbi:MAG: hypothetical protein ACKOJI_01435 [Phycisphaerales bacterium]
MRWWVFLPAMAIALSVDVAFMPVLALGPFEPRLWPVVLAFCAMYASRESTLWAALVTGLWLDAAHATVVASAADPVPSAVPIIGPHVLACLAGAWPVLELRAVLYRRTVPASRQRSSTVHPPVRCSNDARRSESGPRSPSPSSKGTNARSMRGA